MTPTVDTLHPEQPHRVLMVASNPTVSTVTGWPIGFWWAELTHPWWEFTEHGYVVDIASPEGGALRGDLWSDPRDQSGYSAHDLILEELLPLAREADLTRPVLDVIERLFSSLTSQGSAPLRMALSGSTGMARTPSAPFTALAEKG